MLEDDFTHVLRKALLGHGLAPSTAAARAGLPEPDVRALLQGAFCPTTARKLAALLGLNAQALAHHPDYQPLPTHTPGITRLNLPFGNDQVNAWLVSHGDTAILFDAGFSPDSLLDALAAHSTRPPDCVFITHAHHDHTGAIKRLMAAGIPVHAPAIPGTIPMQAGTTTHCGSLAIRACDLSGHASPALGFHLDAFPHPLLITGDALFAGSIGGCSSPALYQLALLRLRETLTPLPDDTILLPGHGPPTTLGQERTSNPFLLGL